MNNHGPLNRGFFLGPDGWPYLLVPFIPLAIAFDLLGAAAGESTWFEGVQLLAVYAVFAIAFFAA